MIQSKNKFLPPLYIRKCKITYLECFAILQRAGCYGQLLLVFKSMTLHLHTTHGCVRVHGWVGMNGWMDGWMGGRINRDQAGALWGTQKKNTDHRKVDTYNVAKQIGTERRGKTREAMNQWTSGGSALCEWLWFLQKWKENKNQNW